SPWKTLAAGTPFKYYVDEFKDTFYVRTDDGAPNRHIFKVDPAHPERDRWVEVIPEKKNASLENFSVVGGRLALKYLEDVKSRLMLHELDGRLVREIPLPAMGTTWAVAGNPDDDEAYFSFSSFTYPTEITEISVKTGKTSLLQRVKVPVDPAA